MFDVKTIALVGISLVEVLAFNTILKSAHKYGCKKMEAMYGTSDIKEIMKMNGPIDLRTGKEINTYKNRDSWKHGFLFLIASQT